MGLPPFYLSTRDYATHMEPILDLSRAPEESLHRLLYLSGVKNQVEAELDEEYQKIYFDLRLSGRLDDAIDLGEHSLRRIMAYTRAENEARGRLIRWGDRRG